MDKQPSRLNSYLSESERETLKTYFKDNEQLLLALRNLLFGFDLDETEKELVKPLVNIKPLLRKIFLPELDRTIPVGQSIDLWMTIKLEGPDRDKTYIEARESLIEKLETALSLIDKPRKVNLLKVEKTAEGLINRNTFITHIEQRLILDIRPIANAEEESQEQLAERLARDSMK